jgi:hypothetical protein
MNPIGFILERYDALGRYRTEERILDATTGAELAVLAIDTSAVPKLSPNDTSSVSEAAQLMQQVADTGLVEECFARNYFRFTYGREEAPEDDSILERVRTALVESESTDAPGSLRAALRAIALDPAFRQRVVGARE